MSKKSSLALTKAKAIKLLKTNTTIHCLDPISHLAFLALKIELGNRNLLTPLAKLEKAWDKPNRKETTIK